MAAGENGFALELNEKEVIELLENTTPGSTKKATKNGMKIFQGKNIISMFNSQSKTMQVETIYKLMKLIITPLAHVGCEMIIANSLGAMPLIGYLSSRIQGVLVETGGPLPRTPTRRRTKQHRCVQTSRAPFQSS